MDTTVIPVEYAPGQGRKAIITPDQIEELTFGDITIKNGDSNIRVTEAELEEFVRRNIRTIFSQETLLIVGQQVINTEGGRCDLVAIDDTGSIVLIELKRDAGDAATRKEAFEFQAIRYAANYAMISRPSDLAQKLFAPYIDKHRGEYPKKELTAIQLATEILEDFLRTNKIKDNEFNRNQRIVLIASSFDPQTLSACAWLSKNGIQLQCLTVSPIRYHESHFLVIEQVIPPPSLDEFYVEVTIPSVNRKKVVTPKQQIPRENLPRMPKLFEWGILRTGDRIYILNHRSEEADIVDQRSIKYNDQIMTYNDWGQKVTGWSAINIYEWAYLASVDKSLDELRREKVEALASQAAEN